MSSHSAHSHASADHHVHSDSCGCPEIDPTKSIRVAVITLSDTRTEADDRSGDAVITHLESSGHEMVDRSIMTDDAEPLAAKLDELAARSDIDAIITTGGTGIAPRDLAVDVIEKRLDVVLPGFGEHFRAISIAEIGPRAMLSRATAGRTGNTAVFALPGSTGAVRTAMTQCVLPILQHVVSLSNS